MSEAPTAIPVEPVAPAATVEPTPTEGATPEPDAAAEAAKWKALARKHEDQSKANADKAKQFDALQEANKTELEKLMARAEAAEKAAAEASVKALRADVATAKGIPAHLLTGSTQEELEASADALLAFKGTAPVAPSAIGQGNVGTPISGETDPIKQLDAQIAEADKVRNFTRAIQLKRERATLVAAKN